MHDDEASARQDARSVFQASFQELVAVLVRIVRDHELARDIAQEAGMRLLDRQGGSIRDARAFLFHVGANLARDALRRGRTRDEHARREALAIDASAPSAEATYDDEAGLARIAAAFERLPPRAREVLWLSRVEGYTNAEVAEAMSISVKTVEKHLAIGLARLTEWLRPGGDR